MQTSEVKARTIRGLTLLVLREGAIKLIAIVGQLLLVRLLVPEYFGVLAIVTFIINTADLFTDLGLVSGVIRSKEKPDSEVLSSLFWIKFTLTGAVVCLILFAAPVFRAIFSGLAGSDILALRILALTLLLRPLRTLIYGLMERELRYDQIPLVDISGLIVYFVTSVLLAFNGGGIWSLVWSLVIKDIVEVALLEFIHPFFPQFRFSWGAVRGLVRFGAPLQANTMLGFLQISTIPFLGGILTTPQAVGWLDWGFNLSSIPRMLSYNIGRVAFPSFSRIQDQPDMIAKGVERSVAIMGIVNFFFLAVTLLFGKEAVQMVIGFNWLPALGALPWLILAEFGLGSVSISQQAIIARGYTRALVRRSALFLVIIWALAAVGYFAFGFVGIAVGVCLGFSMWGASYFSLAKRSGVSVNLKLAFLPPLLVFVFSILCGSLLPVANTLGFLIVKLIIFTLLYAAAIWIFARELSLGIFVLLRRHFSYDRIAR